jgi:hypothetical protein
VGRVRNLGLGALFVCACATPSAAQAPSPAEDGAPGETSFFVQNITRVEAWRFFEPPATGGTEPEYVFVGNRATLGARYEGRRWGMHGAIQYVRIENLPRGAIGPGLLGNGAAYFFQAAGTFSYQFYFRALSASFTSPSRGLTVEAGRLSFTADPPVGSADPAVALAAARLDGRLLGDMDGSLYQRAWDGVRLRASRGAWRWTTAAVLPTQGTFEESANLPLDRVRVVATDVAVAPGGIAAHTQFQGFASWYRDTREVRARPDNSGTLAQAADVSIGTLGLSSAGVYPRGAGAWDVVVWTAGQAGDWYGQPHWALSAVAEGGYRWNSAPGQPWIRAGITYASGDGDGADDRHGTFFTLLPSGDRFVQSHTYALMNVVDAWTEVRVRPDRRVEAAAGVRHVQLASGDDRWYYGSGATERRGNFFGYLVRNTRGARTLGTIAEANLSWQAARWWTLRGYVAGFAGGDAVDAVFAGRRLFTASLESRITF